LKLTEIILIYKILPMQRLRKVSERDYFLQEPHLKQSTFGL
jgi:hypothetical protein